MGAGKKNGEEAEVRNKSAGKGEMHFNGDREQVNIYEEKKNHEKTQQTRPGKEGWRESSCGLSAFHRC